ncbi:hypothetical protein ACS0PU_006898 [Formica fusca]
MLVPQKRKAVIDNESNELSNEKENINEIRSNDIDVKQPPSKVGKVLQNIRMPLNTKSCEQNKTPMQKKKITTVKKELQNTAEISLKLKYIYEKTYKLKKKYYEERLEYLKRSVEAKEKIANIMEKCNMS